MNKILVLAAAFSFMVGCHATEDYEAPDEPLGYCCKICRVGKACGDSCISLSSTCHKIGGCACDG